MQVSMMLTLCAVRQEMLHRWMQHSDEHPLGRDVFLQCSSIDEWLHPTPLRRLLGKFRVGHCR